MDYYGLMKCIQLTLAIAMTFAATSQAMAQTPAAPKPAATEKKKPEVTPKSVEQPRVESPSPVAAPVVKSGDDKSSPVSSGLSAELFYQLLLGELNYRGEEPGTAFSLYLDAARKTSDARLFQRSVDIALQARSADSALQAARAWKLAIPDSREANRYILQILIAINRIAETLEPLRTEVSGALEKDRALTIAVIPRNYARAADRKTATQVVEQALADYTNQPATAAAAWTAIGRMRLSASDNAGAVEAARRGHAADAQAQGPVLLALELMDPKLPAAEALILNYLQKPGPVEIRMSYARALLDAQRYGETSVQIQQVTSQHPEYAEGWLVQGTLQLQDNQFSAAQKSLERYVELAKADDPSNLNEERKRGLVQAYLALSQLAEQQKDFAGAMKWLDLIQSGEDLYGAQARRASILARQGKMAAARKLIQDLPERSPGDARRKLVAQVQLLRDHQQYQVAYDLLAKALATDSTDSDLLYDQAMLADKLGRFDEMERLLRKVLSDKPSFHHAYNALGYSLADRGTRLPEAKQLILKALEFAPGDPFISDSLGWVEFRMGNKAEALRILETAYKTRPDAEIGAHLGEVLWSMGERNRALAIWKEAMLINSSNETLLETLKRLSVKL